MRVLITGIDGYLGWPLALSLGAKGYEVVGIDNGLRRDLVSDEESQSAIPIPTLEKRKQIYQELYKKPLVVLSADLSVESIKVTRFFADQKPEVVVYLGEIPSAPYSMRSSFCASQTQQNNVIGTLNTLYAIQETCPDTHLIKLGTLGEYGTPDCDDCSIPEGKFPEDSEWHIPYYEEDPPFSKRLTYSGNLSNFLFPKQPGSFYHASKVCDSVNVEFACRNWGLRSTDVMQGVIYGTRTDEMIIKDKLIGDMIHPQGNQINENLRTRFDFDECFGTAVNRFCAQAVAGMPLTVYGEGKQKRGFLPLRDCIQCLNLVLENPPEKGEYRVFNQFEEVYSIKELANVVYVLAVEAGLFEMKVIHLENPRNEAAEHYYNPVHQKLFDLGYKPTNDLKGQIREIIEDLIPHRQRILDCKDVLIPKIGWDGKIKERREL